MKTPNFGTINYVGVYRDYVYQVVFYNIPMISSHFCGYVVIDESDILEHTPPSPTEEFDYEGMGIDCHGGLTFGRYINGQPVVGFDCAHCDDTPEVQNQDYCIQQCMHIIDQLADSH